ncbi:MAG: DUF4377 domain-containing protein [Rheinheimera sp.]|nr:DUF4377 domain-containing protein [Rheinheimera sp.]
MLIRTIPVLLLCFVIAACNDDDSKTETIELLSYKNPCVFMTQSLCNVEKTASDIGNFYSEINGFDFLWGHSYKLAVRVTKVGNPAADAPDRVYDLIKVLQHSEDSIGTRYEYPLVELLFLTFTKETDKYYFLGHPFECAAGVDCDALVSLNNTGGLVNVVFEYIGNGKIALVYWD